MQGLIFAAFNFCSILFDDYKNNIRTTFCYQILCSWDETAKWCQKTMLQYIQEIQHLKARWLAWEYSWSCDRVLAHLVNLSVEPSGSLWNLLPMIYKKGGKVLIDGQKQCFLTSVYQTSTGTCIQRNMKLLLQKT